ncbi:MAG: metal-dependent hydrolase [Lentisphaerae bacterium]|nr:metal-dependent hydrolase [Lentisphaerota bacterium]
MASPVLHGLAGAGIAYALAADARPPWQRALRRAAPLMFAGSALANLPDLDYLPGLLSGELNIAHQQVTHSLLWVVLASVAIWLAGRAWRPGLFGARAFWLILLLIGSHLAIDLITADRSPPYGIPLWASFSEAHVQSPFTLLPAWEKTRLADLARPVNLRPLGIELAAGSLLLLGGIIAKNSWARRHPALESAA